MKIAPFVVVGLMLPTWGLATSTTSDFRREALVRCNRSETIGRALVKLDKLAPNTLRVSGTCHENVLIEGFEDLKIVGMPGATLVPVEPATAYAIEVSAARAVSIEGLTIRQAEDRTAMAFAACQDCRLKNVTVDGGIAFYAWAWSQVSLSGFKSTGTGGWTAVGAWQAKLLIEDSVFEDTVGSSEGGRWCGLNIGENAVAIARRSTIRGFGQGIGANGGAYVRIEDETKVEHNWCYGIWGGTRADVNIVGGSRVLNNAETCWGGGISIDSGASLTMQQNLGTGQIQVTGNTGGGIKLNHHAVAQLGGGVVVSSNLGPGLEVRNGSIAVAPGPSNPPLTVAISGNQGDLRCDSFSQINNSAQITGASPPGNQCENLFGGDGPDIP